MSFAAVSSASIAASASPPKPLAARKSISRRVGLLDVLPRFMLRSSLFVFVVTPSEPLGEMCRKLFEITELLSENIIHHVVIHFRCLVGD